MLWFTARTWRLDTVTVTLSHKLPANCRTAVTSVQQNNHWLEMARHQHGVFSPWKHILLSKCWRNIWWIIFSKYTVIKYNNNNRHYIHYLSFVSCHSVLLSPALTLPSLISFQLSTWRDSCNTWNTIVQQFIRPKLKCILFVCPNAVDNLLLLVPHLIYCAPVNNICPLLVEEQHSQFEALRQMKNVHTAEWGSLMGGVCEWTQESHQVLFREMFAFFKWFPKVDI